MCWGDWERSPEEDSPSATNPAAAAIDKALTWRLYTSHFFSTWNSRSFEFAATLFLAEIFPGTLQPLSIYALVRSASAIAFAPSVGRMIDRRSRLPVVRFSIIAGRLAVILSSIGFWVMVKFSALSNSAKYGIFAVLVLLSCLEKVASVTNLVSVERDWVVVIAQGNEPVLQKLNARMRRIDLICKLAGPLVISLIDGASTQAAIWVTFGINIFSLPLEYFCIGRVYNLEPALHNARSQQPITTGEDPVTDTNEEQAARTTAVELRGMTEQTTTNTTKRTIKQRAQDSVHIVKNSFVLYFTHRACLPSFALSLLYLTVLSFGGQMVTYLIAAGYTAFIIALVRTLSVIFELSATWIAPRMMKFIGPIRSGIWFLSWQMLFLGATVSFFWAESTPIIAASGLAGGTILSRIGLWGYDLSAQVIIQSEVQEASRGTFSTTESAFQNAFELISYALTIALPRPGQFRYAVLVSVAAVYSAGFLYGIFVRKRRGHLVHVPCCKSST